MSEISSSRTRRFYVDPNDEGRISIMSTLVEIDSSYPVGENACVPSTVERIESAMTYNDFFSKYLICNKPCVIGLQATENWPCRHEWVLNGAPNFELLRTLFGTWKIQRIRGRLHDADNIINIISAAQDIPLSQLLIVTESFTIRNSRMICPWKITWNIGSVTSETATLNRCRCYT